MTTKTKARTNKTNTQANGLIVNESAHVGYVGILSIPALTIPYAELEDIAQEIGLNKAYLPDKGKPKHSESAWRKAMNLGARGVDSQKLGERFARGNDKSEISKLESSLWQKDGPGYDAIKKHGLKAYQVEVRYIIRDVSGAVPTKHLYREIYVRTDQLADNAKSDRAKTKIAETQLSSQVVMILEYIVNHGGKGKHAATYTQIDCHKFERAICDHVLKPAYSRHQNSADSQRIRVKLAEGLRDNSGLPARQGGGVVIFPASLNDSEINQLNAIREYLNRLAQYMDKPILKSGYEASKPSLQLLPITEESAATFDYVDIVNQELTNELVEIIAWAEKIDPDSTKLGHAKNFNAKAKAMYSEFTQKLIKYQSAMGKQIQLIDSLDDTVTEVLAQCANNLDKVEKRVELEKIEKEIESNSADD